MASLGVVGGRLDIVKLRKSGNSYVVTVPKNILETLGWTESDEIVLEIRTVVPGRDTYFSVVEPQVLVVQRLEKPEEKENG